MSFFDSGYRLCPGMCADCEHGIPHKESMECGESRYCNGQLKVCHQITTKEYQRHKIRTPEELAVYGHALSR